MAVDKNLLSGSNTMLVLRVLEREDLYGYQLIQKLRQQSDGAFELQEGTLYPILHALERDGFVTSRLAQAETGRTRKYYHLTDAGREELDRQRQQWREYAQAVEGFVFRPGPATV